MDARETTIAQFKAHLETKRETLEKTRNMPTKYVIYTGKNRVWVNVVAAANREMSISLRRASKYDTREGAEQGAAHICDGNGALGQVCTLLEACKWEVRNLEDAIALLQTGKS